MEHIPLFPVTASLQLMNSIQLYSQNIYVPCIRQGQLHSNQYTKRQQFRMINILNPVVYIYSLGAVVSLARLTP